MKQKSRLAIGVIIGGVFSFVLLTLTWPKQDEGERVYHMPELVVTSTAATKPTIYVDRDKVLEW